MQMTNRGADLAAEEWAEIRHNRKSYCFVCDKAPDAAFDTSTWDYHEGRITIRYCSAEHRQQVERTD